MKQSYIAGLGYRGYKRYVRFMNDHIMYRRIYYLNKENIPALGEPCMIVSNHQNCANDPLILLLGLENKSHPFIIARGNVFSWHPIITRFFLWLGMLPAFRLAYDGEENLKNNAETIRISGGKMLEGNRLIMYPEGGHQDKRWLGDFSYGYTRLAFETAESDGFRHDIKILPSANHYSNYFGLQADAMIHFGTPISLEPYYELYKQKPRTAQREVNRLVREQIENLMLDIRDLEHYDQLDWLRESEYGDLYAKSQGLRASCLPDKLKADKQLVAALAEKTDETSEFLFNQIDEIREEEKRLGVNEEDMKDRKGWGMVLLSLLAQLLLLPLWLVSLYPNGIHYGLPKLFLRTDRMFENSWTFIIPVVVGIPFFFLLTVLVCGLVWGWWWQSAVWMLLMIYPGSLFAWYEWKWMQKTVYQLRLLCRKKQVANLLNKRKLLFDKLNKKLNIK